MPGSRTHFRISVDGEKKQRFFVENAEVDRDTYIRRHVEVHGHIPPELVPAPPPPVDVAPAAAAGETPAAGEGAPSAAPTAEPPVAAGEPTGAPISDETPTTAADDGTTGSVATAAGSGEAVAGEPSTPTTQGT